MPDRYLSFSRVAVSFGALVSVAALRSTTTVLSMESWVGGGGGRDKADRAILERYV